MQFVPTSVDLANAGKYYAGYVRARQLVERNSLGIKMNVERRDLTSDDLPGVYDSAALGQVLTATWAEDCDRFSCYPFDINGDMCTPDTAPQYWRTVDGSMYAGCQPSCYGMIKYDTDNPQPSGFPLTAVGGKCTVRNAAKALWFGTPRTRAGDSGTVDGLSNVPPMVVANDGTIAIPKSYCDWFGMSFSSDGCYRPWYQLVLEDYLMGKTLYRVFTIDRNSSLPSQQYAELINSDEYHSTYQKLAAVWKRHDPQFVPYRNSRHVFNSPIPIFNSATLARDSRLVQRRAVYTADGDSFDFQEMWESLDDNILLALLRDVLADQATEKLLEIMSQVLKRLAKYLETAVASGIERIFALGGKNLLTAAIQSTVGGLVLRAAGNFVVRGVTLLASAFAQAVATFNVVQLTLGIAGLILDLVDPLALNSYLDDSTIDSIIQTFDNTYLDNFRSSQYTIEPIELLSIADSATEDEFYLDAITASSVYLSQLKYNSLGQHLNWDDDSDSGTPHNQERTETINKVLFAPRQTDTVAWNNRQREYLETTIPAVNSLATSTAIFAAACTAVAVGALAPQLRTAMSILALVLLCTWLVYKIRVVAKKNTFENTLFRITQVLLSRKS